jgi:alanyl-tRNA synthetase
MKCRQENVRVLSVVPEKRTHAYLILDRTIFHPKGGGQPSDRGMIRSPNYEVIVKKAIYYKGVVVHWGKLSSGTPTQGQAACELDWGFRYLVMRRHTAAHLLDHCLAETTLQRVQTTDSWLDESCYVGYSGDPPDTQTLQKVQALANRLIQEGRQVKIEFLSPERGKMLLQNAPNYERLPELSEIRIVTINGCQPIPCGGTHVSDIREVGMLSVIRAEEMSTHSFRLYFSVDANASETSACTSSS